MWEDCWTDKKVIWKMNNEYVHFPQDLEYIPGWQNRHPSGERLNLWSFPTDTEIKGRVP